MLRYLLFFFVFSSINGLAQSGYWQQHVHYDMTIDFDASNHQFSGVQKLAYTNNSPDTLNRVYYHLYFNAFQPASAMDVRSRSIADPDPRIGARIAELKPNEQGFHKIESLKQDGKLLQYHIDGTLLIVELNKPILPHASTHFEMTFNSQVPIQIRRSGRNNSEGIDYTMTQWYPKMAEYDKDGWHTDPYVAREFHGVFGTFEVTLDIDEKYIVAGTGTFDSPEKANAGRNRWYSKAENVHDFAWAADPDFVHTTRQVKHGPMLHFYHVNDTSINENWEKLEPKTVQLFEIMNAQFGVYPYSRFSVIQAGDGGMEYPMCTMISGTGSIGGLVSVTVHEAIHNWYYGVLASNELKYPWMDEGFTTYAQNIVLDSIFDRKAENPHHRSFSSYINFVTRSEEQPLTTHADHYLSNSAYGVASYSKGCVFLAQLRYIVGTKAFDQAMIRYFNVWKFKHPTPQDFKRIMESISGLQLDWYFDGWINSKHQIDYGIRTLTSIENKTSVIIERIGELEMPLEVEVETDKGIRVIYIPLTSMRGEKDFHGKKNIGVKEPWTWPFEYYELLLDLPIHRITSISLGSNLKFADVNPDNNFYPFATDDLIQPSDRQ